MTGDETGLNELQFFWTLAKETRQAVVAGDARTTRECRNDLMTMIEATKNPQIKARAQALLAELSTPTEQTVCASSV